MSQITPSPGRTPVLAQSSRRSGRRRVWSHRLALLLSAATVVLLAAGALVTSTGSSLAVPDWPLAYGQLFPPMVGGIFYEHGHRLIAATVGLLAILTAGWLWRCEPRAWVRWLGLALVLAVVFQGLLGGLTVLLLLPKAISIGHALMAQLFFLLTVTLAQVTAPGWEGLVEQGRRPAPSRVFPWSAALFAALLVELALGAVMRHYGAGLAIPDFPLVFGGIVPPVFSFPVAVHFLHRAGAVAVVILAAGTCWGLLRRHAGNPALLRPGLLMAALTVFQISLGGGIVLTQLDPAWTVLHLVNGALLIATAGVLALRGRMLTRLPAAGAMAGTMERRSR
ncbi:MAG: heme A synthase [SAR324 cluster bacterium]|nr:heme A synthase [SAR324 cluster bacterium]